MMSLGGGGGNILRSVKALYQRDLTAEGRVDGEPPHRVTARFLDTNQYSLVDVPPDERLLIGPETTRFLGARHDPEVARRAFDESRDQIAALMRDYSMVILIATGGKGTGTGTLLPTAILARQMRKLVIPIFVRPSFERHEVEKRRFDHALNVSAQLDAAQIRFIEILNDRGYLDTDPQPQSVVWERMNVPIARALRGLLTCCRTCRRSTLLTCRRSSAVTAAFVSALPSSIHKPFTIPPTRLLTTPYWDAGPILTATSAIRSARPSSAFRARGRTSPTRRSKAVWRPKPPRPGRPPTIRFTREHRSHRGRGG